MPRAPLLLVIAALGVTADAGRLTPRLGSASASSLTELAIGELVLRSSLVVVGTPREARSVWESPPAGRARRIVTYSRVELERILDGQPAAEVWIRTLGGQLEGIGQQVEGEALPTTGQRFLFFLRPLDGEAYAVVGLSQGQFRLDVAPDGGPPRLAALKSPAHFIARPLPDRSEPAPARTVLSGKTVDEAAQLILAERRRRAP